MVRRLSPWTRSAITVVAVVALSQGCSSDGGASGDGDGDAGDGDTGDGDGDVGDGDGDAGDGDGDVGDGDGDESTGGDSGTGGATGGTSPGGMGGETNGTGGDDGGTGGDDGGTGGAGSEPPHDCSAPDGSLTTLSLNPLVSGLVEPILAVAAPGSPDVLFVVEQGGVIKRANLETGMAPVFLDISAKTDRSSLALERGLLGLAFHPDYAQNGLFYVHYTDVEGDTMIEEYERSSAFPGVANPTPKRTILELDQNYPNSNGGNMAFHPTDGLLYVGLGDGGSAGDPMGNAQDAGNLLGSFFGIDVDQNPVPAPTSWDIGLRNPLRFSFDVCTGDRYIADQSNRGDQQEINIAAHAEARNWGWSVLDGNECAVSEPCETAGFTPPAHVFQTILGGGPFNLGGFVYRGSALPELRGMYLFADPLSGKVWGLRWTEAGGVTDVTELTTLLGTTGKDLGGFGQDEAGEVYLIERDPGVLYAIER